MCNICGRTLPSDTKIFPPPKKPQETKQKWKQNPENLCYLANEKLSNLAGSWKYAVKCGSLLYSCKTFTCMFICLQGICKWNPREKDVRVEKMWEWKEASERAREGVWLFTSLILIKLTIDWQALQILDPDEIKAIISRARNQCLVFHYLKLTRPVKLIQIIFHNAPMLSI